MEKETRELLISVRWESGLSTKVLRQRDIRLNYVDNDERRESHDKKIHWEANRKQSDGRSSKCKGVHALQESLIQTRNMAGLRWPVKSEY